MTQRGVDAELVDQGFDAPHKTCSGFRIVGGDITEDCGEIRAGAFR
jgi:hypothetical protein